MELMPQDFVLISNFLTFNFLQPMLVTNGKIIVAFPQKLSELEEALALLKQTYPDTDVFSIAGPAEAGQQPEYWIDIPETHTYASLKEVFPRLVQKAINEDTFKIGTVYPREVLYKLTLDDKRKIADEQNQLWVELGEVEKAKAAAAADFAAKIKSIEAKISLANQRYTAGEENREMALYKVLNFADQMVYWVDEDGNVMDTTNFTMADIQMKLNFGEETPETPAAETTASTTSEDDPLKLEIQDPDKLENQTGNEGNQDETGKDNQTGNQEKPKRQRKEKTEKPEN